MRTLITSVVAASAMAFASLGVSAGVANAGQKQPSGAMVHCLSGNGGSGSWTVQWIKEGNGRCPGQILASDAVKLASLADKGHTEFRVAFYIPEKCPKTEWASFPVKAENGKLNMYPWRKLCTGGHFAPRVVK